MYNVNVDIMTPQGSQGPVANQLVQQTRLDPGSLRPWMARDGRCYVTVYIAGDPKDAKSYRNIPITRNAFQVNGTLRRDEWKELDQAVQRISEIRLGGVQDLIDNNLVYNLGNAMGTTVLEYHSISNAMTAVVTMDGVTRGPGDRVTYQTHYLPIPIIHVDFEINARALAASRSLGNPLDVDNVERGTRKINEMLETMLFGTSDTPYGFGTAGDDGYNSIYSYCDHPKRNTGSLTGAWTALTGAQIITDVTNMKQASINDKHYGPWMLYVPTAYETVLDKDYDATTPGTTIRERIMKIAGIKGIKVIDTLAAGTVLLVQMTTDTVRLIRGMGVQVVEWMTEGQFITKYKVMTIQVPQIRADQDGNCGVIHYSA
jgi:hypothetical protein